MPNLNTLNYIVSQSVADLSQVRLPAANKPFEQLTIGELVQMRPGGAAADSYNINAVGSDVTISTSSKLADLAALNGQQAVRSQLAANDLRNVLATSQVVTKISTP